jgi:hypothetical protein
MRNLTLTTHACDIPQSPVSATKHENTSNSTLMDKLFNFNNAGNNFTSKFENCRFIFVEFF